MTHFVFQIKEKLKEHGIAENTTIKWKQQPDGLVFHKIENNDEENKAREICDL